MAQVSMSVFHVLDSDKTHTASLRMYCLNILSQITKEMTSIKLFCLSMTSKPLTGAKQPVSPTDKYAIHINNFY